MKKYYALEQENREADITIYGDITSWPWMESDVSAYWLSKQIDELDVDTINVYINSYGGEVAEGWAIYNALRRHKAQVHTFADGFVCSIASVIFMAGEKRTMSNLSALMIHNPWTRASGNADDLRKEAENLDTFGELSAKAYLEYVDISEDELAQMLEAESWITPEAAVSMGFATNIADETKSGKVSQSAKESVFAWVAHPMPVAKLETMEVDVDADKICEKICAMLEKKVKEKQEAEKKEEPNPKPDFLKFLSAI